MTAFIISFLILLNPFALFIYILPVKKEHGLNKFNSILIRASLISYAIYLLFAIFGPRLFEFLLINFEAFRIFGGIVLTGFALSFILQGRQSMITTRGELNKIAAEIALPFIVGAGTITQSILIGNRFSDLNSAFIIACVMLINYAIVMGLIIFRTKLKPKMQIVFDRNAEIVLRVTGFLVGAYGINLIVVGVQNLIK